MVVVGEPVAGQYSENLGVWCNWLTCLLWEQETAGSTPVTQTLPTFWVPQRVFSTSTCGVPKGSVKMALFH